MKKIYTILLLSLVSFGSCSDYLDRKNLDSFDDANFWSSEANMQVFAQNFYLAYFTGYSNAWSWGRYFTSGASSDEYYNSSTWGTTTPATSDSWSFTWVRRSNLMLDRVDLMPVSDEAKEHWRGVARFYRAKEYADLVRTFGDVPLYTSEIYPSTPEEILYKDRDPLSVVAQQIVEDYKFAAANVRLFDGVNRLHRYVVLAYMSRDLLHMGSLLKYHKNDATAANTMFSEAKWAAEQVMAGPFQIVDDLRGIFTSDDLSGGNYSSNREVIFFRAYATGKVTHSLITYSAGIAEPQQGLTQRAVDAFLASDGLPIKQSPLYNYSSDNNIRYFPQMYANRDPRLAATVCDTLRINGVANGYAITGYCVWKFTPYTLTNPDQYTADRNFTDAPIIRFGEVLLNYAEAAAELGQFDQAAADRSINVLRNRNIRKNNQGEVLPKLPPMTLSGNEVFANGVQINDPDRDASVSSVIWELRRERWVELMQEGFRREDLRRWKMYKYMDNSEVNGVPSTAVRGAIFDYTKYTPAQQMEMRSKINIAALYPIFPGDSTYIALNPMNIQLSRRPWIDGDIGFERQYFSAVPTNQITIYNNHGFKLTQNPGWDSPQ